MADIYDVMWPAGVPHDLWNLSALSDSAPVLPFMDISISQDFIMAALVGGAILVAFGWKRFNLPAYSGEADANRVLSALTPMRMRGQRATTWAYTAYVCLMLGLYIVLTFFGELILTLSNNLPIAGVQVDAETLNLDTPGWPLALALGFAGLAPILPPVAAVETWMRTVVHTRFGIPARLEGHAEKLVIEVRDKVRALDEKEKFHPEEPPDWLKDHLRANVNERRVFRLREELRLFIHWNSEDLGWPNIDERRDIAGLKDQMVREAREVLDDFDDIVDGDPTAETKQDIMAAPGFSDAQGNNFPQSGRGKPENTPARQRKKREQLFDRSAERMETLRDELATILALAAERDSAFNAIDYKAEKDEPNLRDLLQKVFPETHVASPVPGLLWICPLLFPCLALGVHFRYVAPLGSVTLTTGTTLLSAALHLLNYIAVIVLPAMAVFFWRYRLIDTSLWTSMPAFVRVMVAGGIAMLVSIAASVAVAVFWYALISANGEQLREHLFDVKFPKGLMQASMAVIAAWVVCCAVLAEEMSRSDSGKPRVRTGPLRVLVGVGAAVATFGLIFGHRYFWYGARYGEALKECHENDATTMTAGLCQLELLGPEVLILPLVAFLACTPLMRLSVPEAHERRDDIIASVILLAILLFAIPTRAMGQALTVEEPDRVVVGFRADAEPFVFRLAVDGEEMYTGYLADLCYAIFDNSRYEILPVEITAADRFENLLTPEDLRESPRMLPDPANWRELERETRLAFKVDVLCDPITLRYEESTETGTPRTSGIFSPILFASGVSFLEINKSQAGNDDPYVTYSGPPDISHDYGRRAKPVLVGYIENSTAAEVAEELCEHDHFGMRSRAETRLYYHSETYDALHARLEDGAEACSAPKLITDTDPAALCDPADLDYGKEAESLYRFCVMKSHRELMRWFCSDNVSAYHRVYLGDRDLIHGKLETWREDEGKCGETEVVETATFFTYEPYALLVTRTRPELVRHVQRRVYEFFSDRDGALGKFGEHFPGQKMSPALAYLHLINAVSRPGLFKHADYGDEGDEAKQ